MQGRGEDMLGGGGGKNLERSTQFSKNGISKFFIFLKGEGYINNPISGGKS